VDQLVDLINGMTPLAICNSRKKPPRQRNVVYCALTQIYKIGYRAIKKLMNVYK
jgi:hypothetical protein